MRKSFWFGLVLVVVGLIVALGGPTYNDEVADFGVGEAEVTIQEREGVPAWLGWAAAGIGLVLMVTGIRGRSSRTFDERPSRTFDERRPHAP